MNKNCKICWTILVIFFVANVALLSLWWLKSEKEGSTTVYKESSKDKARTRLRDHFRDELEMDESQFDGFNQMRNEHMQKIALHQMQIDSIDSLLKNITFSSVDNPEQIAIYADQMAEHHKQIELLNYSHYKSLRKNCRNDMQRERMDNTFRRLIEKKHKRHRRGRGSHKN